MMGAEIQYFSPLVDASLPKDIDGIYLGGGCMDFYLKELQENRTLMHDIKKKIVAGIPTYVEGDGLMYLSEHVINRNNEKFNMIGALPGYCNITEEINKSGYVDIEVMLDSVLAQKGCRIRGHEFHRSSLNILPDDVLRCFSIQQRSNDLEPLIWKCGYSVYNMLAAYPQLHFWSNPNFAVKFVESCSKYRSAVVRAI
jgi:cobyrinic acid a,c-diamide synthase